MKKLILLYLLLLPFISQGQLYFNGKSEVELDIKYYVLVSIEGYFKECRLRLLDGLQRRNHFLTDINGKQLLFLRKREVFDFMHERGWEYVGLENVSDGSGRELVFKKRTIMSPPEN